MNNNVQTILIFRDRMVYSTGRHYSVPKCKDVFHYIIFGDSGMTVCIKLTPRDSLYSLAACITRKINTRPLLWDKFLSRFSPKQWREAATHNKKNGVVGKKSSIYVHRRVVEDICSENRSCCNTIYLVLYIIPGMYHTVSVSTCRHIWFMYGR